MKRLVQKIWHSTGISLGRKEGLRQVNFASAVKWKLVSLAVVLAGLWHLAAPATLASEERALWQKVRAAQLHMAQWREQQGTATTVESDPWRCGLIGVEWSGITTTLGDLSSKRTACNPAWAVQFNRWFHELDLKPGDRIGIYSSGSFPGLLLNIIAAAEAAELDPLLIVSLGASTWGANHLDSPWPVMAAELRRSGFIVQKADYYTLGGGAELGHGLAPEGVALLQKAASDSGVELLTTGNLEEMITLKTDLLQRHQPRLFVNIGGSHANLGGAEEILKLKPGLVPATEIDHAGNGVIAAAMHGSIPVIHMLNVKSVSYMTGIPYDASPGESGPVRMGTAWALAGIVLFFAVLLRHRRWALEPAEDKSLAQK